jgi:tryptophan synthase alpha chain
MSGIERISGAFAATHAKGRAALMPYFTGGFPDLRTSEDVLVALAETGADLIEIGVPFSDPLADGPVIQNSTQVALDDGMTVAKCLELVGRVRVRGVKLPIMLMGYTNPILAYGSERYVRDAAAVGTDGLIVPDLPPEEAVELEAACHLAGLAMTFLAAPTTTPERLRYISEHSSGFLYLVSLTGVTGARDNMPVDLGDFIARARVVAHTPLAVGFGISRREQVAEVGKIVDGVIVGSALIKAVAEAGDAVSAAASFVRSLSLALSEGTRSR